MAKFWIAAILIAFSQNTTEQTTAVSPTKVQFFDGFIEDAQALAEAEGKLYFVDFVASWCQPCKWMDETTYQDESLANFIEKNYVPVKIDVDKLDYYHYQDVYNVQLLPTIIIFNAKGEVLGRYEESMAPTKMKTILASFNLPKNKGTGKKPVAKAKKIEPTVNEPVIPEVKEQVVDVSEPEIPNDYPKYEIEVPNPENNIVSSDNETVLVDDNQPEYKEPVQPENPNVSINDNPNPAVKNAQATNAVGKSTENDATVDEGLYNFKLFEQDSEGFSVQVGAFSEQNNVLKEIQRLQVIFIDQPIIVHVGKIRGRQVYKIYVGEFPNRSKATLFLNIVMKKQGVSGMVKDLSLIK